MGDQLNRYIPNFTVRLTPAIERQRDELEMLRLVRRFEIAHDSEKVGNTNYNYWQIKWAETLQSRVDRIKRRMRRIARAVGGPFPISYLSYSGKRYQGVGVPVALNRVVYTYTCKWCSTPIQSTDKYYAGVDLVHHVRFCKQKPDGIYF